MKARATTIAVFAIAALTASAGAANAAPHSLTVHASTTIKDRPDGGHGGTWAYDYMTRDIKITLTGGTAGAYTYTAKLKDTGTFRAIKGALTPNQGGSYLGDTIKSKIPGRQTKLNGSADFSFTASTLPSAGLNAGVPKKENDGGSTPVNSTGNWYKLAFPSGTTFGGAGLTTYSWTYDAIVVKVTKQQTCLSAHWCWTTPVVNVTHQQWVDSSANGDGDLQADGNIEG